MTADKGCQTEEIKIIEEDFSEDETNHYLLLELIANDLESSDIIIESVDGDQVDGFRETIKLLVEKLFEQIKYSTNNNVTKPDYKKVTYRRNYEPKIFVPRPQEVPNIRKLIAGDKPWKRKLTDAIAKSDQIVNRTRKKMDKL